MADKVGFISSTPRLAKRQQHCGNILAKSAFEYYKKNVTIPFLYHIISNQDDRFSSLVVTATSLLGFVPTIVCTRNVDITNALEMYQEDLPSPELVTQENHSLEAAI